jgi:hypothetical protein
VRMFHTGSWAAARVNTRSAASAMATGGHTAFASGSAARSPMRRQRTRCLDWKGSQDWPAWRGFPQAVFMPGRSQRSFVASADAVKSSAIRGEFGHALAVQGASRGHPALRASEICPAPFVRSSNRSEGTGLRESVRNVTVR